MKKKIEKFMGKHCIDPENIMYIIRKDDKSCIYMSDGNVIESYFSIKKILETLDKDTIITVNKGIAVSLSYVVKIKDGKYEMPDGMVLKGRVRTPGEHKRNNIKIKTIETETSISIPHRDLLSEQIRERFSILDGLPLPFAVFEMKYKEEKPIDIIFKYLNPKMAELAESSVESALGKSFYSVFSNGDKKWIDINGEVAVTGEAKSVHRFSPEVGRYLSLYYYCPVNGYCACVVVK